MPPLAAPGRAPEKLAELASDHLGALPEPHGRREELVPVLAQARCLPDHERQRLVPRAQVRFVVHPGRLHGQDVGQQNKIGFFRQQVGHVPMRDDDGETRFSHHAFQPGLDDLLVGRVAQDGGEAQVRHEGSPEGQALQREHGQGNSHGRRAGPGLGQVRFVQQQLAAEGEQVLDHRQGSGLGPLAEAVGALVAPVGLLALDVEFLDLATVGAALAGELPQLVVHL